MNNTPATSSAFDIPAHAPFSAPPSPADLMSHLDGIRTSVAAWLKKRLHPDGRGFALCEHALVDHELNATTGGIELWQALGLPLSDAGRMRWIDTLRAYQNPRTGLVCDPSWQARQLRPNAGQLEEGDTFFTMTSAAALEALGSGFEHPVAYLANLPAGLLADHTDWFAAAHNPRAIGDYGRFIRINARLRVPGADEQSEWLRRALIANQNADTGLWPVDHRRQPLTPAINQGFHLLRSSWNLIGEPCPHADKILASCLEACDDPAFYGWEHGYACNDLDLALVVWTANRWSDHRSGEIQAWARRRLPLILAVQKADGAFSFNHDRAMAHHGGIRMSEGLAESDMWGTVMYLGAIKMMVELGYPGMTAPWGFNRVHALPAPADPRALS
jgi:hypothetical protein